MTIPRMEAISRRWQRIPPLSVLVANIAAALGWQPPNEPAGDGNIQELVDLMGSGSFATEKPAWLTT